MTSPVYDLMIRAGHVVTEGGVAAADIAVYREEADREAMFATPEYVFKDGRLVARKGRIEAVPVGGTHFVEADYDPAIEKTVEAWADRHASISYRHMKIGTDELCSCSNGGALLACKVHGRGRAL